MPSWQSTTPTILHYRNRENFSKCTSINFRTCKSVVLFNGDVCKIGDWVLAANGMAEQSLIVACIREIIQRQGSDADKLLRPDAILLERGSVGEPACYSMPAVRAHGGFLLYPVEVGNVSVILPVVSHCFFVFLKANFMCSESATPMPSTQLQRLSFRYRVYLRRTGQDIKRL